jgi:hypothetical protein
MKALMVLLALVFATTVLVGCHASGSINPNDSSSVSLPR